MIDLHSHSLCSDGSETPRRVVELAADAGCRAVALTDHDGLDGNEEAAARAEELGIRFIAGCEVSCVSTKGTMHLLSYFVATGTGPLQGELANLRRDRDRRNERLLARLQALDLPISAEELVAEAGSKIVGRPHFAAVLVKNGAVGSIDEAFTRYLAKGRPAYVSKSRVNAAAIVDLTRRSGGVSSLAHPLSLELTKAELERLVGELRDVGLTGLECYYGRYDDDTRRSLVGIARRNHLVPTGGSDFHGSYKPDLRVGTGTGDLSVPDSVLDELDSARRPIAG